MRVWLVAVAFLVGCNSDYDLGANLPPLDLEEEEPDTQGVPEDEDTPPDDGNPVAVCTVTLEEVTPPFESTIFDGGESHDPDGHPIEDYVFTLAHAPSGSSAMLVGGSSTRSLTPDMAGEYVVTLVVRTDDGRESESVHCDVTAIPGENLWIEMYWEHDTDDMDLHLVRPGGTPFDFVSDCYYANKNPNWGGTGQQDNPQLDLDDIPGVGAENINIATPSESGQYLVFVNDYIGSNGYGSDYLGGNAVTVNIYIGGVLLWNDTRVISGDETDTNFAYVNWPQRTVTGL